MDEITLEKIEYDKNRLVSSKRKLVSECAPAENGTGYLTWCVQGQVSDNNAYALGGVAGHAGVFSTAIDLEIFLRQWLFGGLIRSDVYNLWIKEVNHSQSSRALGWNTNDPGINDQGWNLSCGDKLSPLTYMHTGYTGTMICADPANQWITILLTNRVYPTDANGSSGIHDIRRRFGDAVADTIKQVSNSHPFDAVEDTFRKQALNT